jgi:hypothetical protein
MLLARTIELFGFNAQSDVSNSISIAAVIVADSPACRTGGLFADRLADRQPNSIRACIILVHV